MTRALRCRLRISRVAGATSPGDRIPVATWYSRGWKRWCVVRATTVTSTGALRRARAAKRPPKPDPTMTTRCRRCDWVKVMGVSPPGFEATGALAWCNAVAAREHTEDVAQTCAASYPDLRG